MSSMYALPSSSHVSKYFPSFLHVTKTCRRKEIRPMAEKTLCRHTPVTYHDSMKKLFDALKRTLTAFLEFFSAPPRRGQCPHCGGGKCYGACQLVRKEKPAGKA